MSWRVHVHSARLTNKALSLRENDLVLLMFATHVMMHSQTCAHTCALFYTWGNGLSGTAFKEVLQNSRDICGCLEGRIKV